MTSRHYSGDAKEVNILIVVHCFKIGIKLGVFNIAIYGKTVRCSLNSFEQCTMRHKFNNFHLIFTMQIGMKIK